MRHRSPLIAVLVSAVLAVGWWYLLYQPSADEQEAFESETAQLEQEEARLRAEIAELVRVRDDEMAIRAELSLMEEYIPNGVDQPTALRELQDAADAAGVVIDTVAFGAPVAVAESPATGEQDTTLAEIGISMTATGGYFQQVDLFRRLEVSVPRAFLVDSVTMGEGGEDFPTLSTTWTGRMFAVVDIAATVESEEGEPPGTEEGGDEAEDAPEGEDAPDGEDDLDDEGAVS